MSDRRPEGFAIRNLIFATLFAFTVCAKKSTSNTCTVTTDCANGLFCVGGACKANTGSGLSCTSEADCKAQEACINGVCGQEGCDASHACNDGCCNAGQCVTTGACPGGLQCGTEKMCPARCDTASGGSGCTAGCCDTSSGGCLDGTSSTACGGGGDACLNCAGVGAACTQQACVCADTSCNGVCTANGCVACNTNPCGGKTPFCDDTQNHVCEGCSAGGAHYCAKNFTSTPYCVSDGACSPTPDSSAACADADPNNPVLIGGKCGCDATSTCPNGFVCNNTTNTCYTDCTKDSECKSGQCRCSDVACDTHVCTTACTDACKYASSSACDIAAVTDGAPAPDCSDSAHTCLGGACTLTNGQTCTTFGTNSACASGFCSYGTNSGSSPLVCTAVQCGACQYASDVNSTNPSTACASISTSGTTTSQCGTSGCNAGTACGCDGLGTCKIADEAKNCGGNGQCLNNSCIFLNSNGDSHCDTDPKCPPSTCQYDTGVEGCYNVTDTVYNLSCGYNEADRAPEFCFTSGVCGD